MRRLSIVFLALLLGTNRAQAEQWQARLSLLADKSPGSCAMAAQGGTTVTGSTGQYTFDLTGDTFAGTAPTGKLFTTKLAGDGSVNHEYKSSSGARLVISGNVKSRKLQIKNLNSFCIWDLVPIAN